MKLEPKPVKAMIVACGYGFCINNKDGKCTLDEISISQDGLCEEAFDRMKYLMAQSRRNELEIKPKIIKNN